MTTLKSTGIFWTKNELAFQAQLLGMVKDSEAESQLKSTLVYTHNKFLELMGDRYEYDWHKVQVNPDTREVLAVCEDCDESLSENDVSIE